MCERKKRAEDQDNIERQGFRDRHDSKIFAEPFDFFHVFSGLDFPRLSLDKFLDKFEMGANEDKD